jgi:signal transduction histidine kinase
MAAKLLQRIQRPAFKCMVIAPEGREFEEIRETIKSVAAESRIQLISVDEALPFDLTERILAEVQKVDLILTIFSPTHTSSFYEVGLVRGAGKPVFFLVDQDLPVPFFASHPAQMVSYNRSSSGLRRLHLVLRKMFEDFRRDPRRFRALSQVAGQPTILPVIDLDRLEPREFENLCFELLTQMGYRRVEWGKQLEDIDVVATLPRKDPDGFEYEELWLISAGLRAPLEMLLQMVTREPDYLIQRIRRSGTLAQIRSKPSFDTPITLLLIMVRDLPPPEVLQHELRRMESRIAERHSPYTVRVRVWDRQQITGLIQQHSQIAFKYFSDEGRVQSEYRKSYEQLYLENTSLVEKNQATIKALEEERDKRVRAERDAVWKDVAFTAAHKLGNPIFALETNLQGLKRNIATKPEVAKEVAAEMGASIETAKSIIDQFKSLTKAQEISPRATDIVPLLNNAAKVAIGNGVQVKLIADKRGVQALVDPTRMAECFDELFANALHWLDKKQKSITVTVDVAANGDLPPDLDRKRRYLKIRFEDNGRGVAAIQKEKIFAPFYTTYPHGTGIGLSLVERVIEGHGGAIREVGKPEEGAVFEIYLPQVDLKRQGK